MNKLSFQSEKSVNEKDVRQTSCSWMNKISSVNSPEWVRTSGILELYVMDFGIILRSKKKATYFALNDSKSMLQRFRKILNPGYFDIYTFNDDFAKTYIDGEERQKMEEYVTLLEKDARSLNRNLELVDIPEIIDFVPAHQRKIFVWGNI
ncbi:MAG: hypothetical protein IKP60_10410 [Treponema sp.]|nr:hypothetical protein [Treponema sp.]